MPLWIIAAALGSVALTALLTFVLWRLNAPLRERSGRNEGGDASGVPIVVGGDAHGDGTGGAGSDCGGDGGGGGK